MGVRGRTSQHANASKLRATNSANDKRFSRRKAEYALTHGADPTEERFTKHQNYHVVDKAAKMANAAEHVPVLNSGDVRIDELPSASV